MTNRINELIKRCPKTKENLDLLINTIASYSNIIDKDFDLFLSKELDKLTRSIEYGLRNNL